jgi:hypothetical protein
VALRRIGVAAVLLGLLCAFTVPPLGEGSAGSPALMGDREIPVGFPHFGRVAVLILENREYREVIGRRRSPYLTRLARRYALETRYFALGHPSMPNYLALTAGSTLDLHHDCNGCDFSQPNLLNQLDSAGIPWRAYFEGLPRSGYLGARYGRYSTHLNPFAHYASLVHSADRSRVVSFHELASDLRGRRLPRFVWVAPNLCHDGHYCTVRRSNRYLSRLVPKLLRELGPRGVLFLTWDEGKTHAGAHGARGGGHVALIAAGPAARRGVAVRTVATHYSLLKTIEAGLGLPALGRASSPSTPLLTGLVRR